MKEAGAFAGTTVPKFRVALVDGPEVLSIVTSPLSGQVVNGVYVEELAPLITLPF